MSEAFTESTVEQAALAWLESVGWSVRHGSEIAPGEPGAGPNDYGQVVLEQRLRDALARLNPDLPARRRRTPSAGPAGLRAQSLRLGIEWVIA